MMGRILAAMVAAMTFVCVHTPARSEAYQYYPNSPLHLGSNFDPRQMADAKLPCVTFKGRLQLSAYDPMKPLGMETQYTVDQLKTRKQLYEYLHISASVSGHYKFFSGGGSYDLEQENTFDSDSFSWVMRGYLIASSRNPRQFVQRRGRILRRSPGKEFAKIFDFVVVMPEAAIAPDQAASDFLRGELTRVADFARNSLYPVSAVEPLLPYLRKYRLEHLAI